MVNKETIQINIYLNYVKEIEKFDDFMENYLSKEFNYFSDLCIFMSILFFIENSLK